MSAGPTSTRAALLVGPSTGDAQATGAPHIVERIDRTPTRRRGSWNVKALQDTQVRSRLVDASSARPLSATQTDGSPRQFLVLAERSLSDGSSWVEVRLDRRPNTATGWISRDDLRMSTNPWWIDISRRSRSLELLYLGRVRLRTRVVVGTTKTPTPAGLFATSLVARQRNPQAFLGTWAVHLTAHSEVLEDFGGGPGRVAIHGRGPASLGDPLGSARSHGCVRIPNAAIGRLARVPLGTPVRIS